MRNEDCNALFRGTAGKAALLVLAGSFLLFALLLAPVPAAAAEKGTAVVQGRVTVVGAAYVVVDGRKYELAGVRFEFPGDKPAKQGDLRVGLKLRLFFEKGVLKTVEIFPPLPE
jgi:hypothetical protein